jgi:tetratricopeptide (TPR) repeat protein
VLDDVHWATPIMLDGVLDVAGQTKGPVLLLAVGRPDMLELVARGGEGPWWRGLPDVELLPVLPLEESAIERLLRAYLGTPTDDLDVAVRSALLSRAQGNPFFLAELLHLLVDRGRSCGPATAGRCAATCPRASCRRGAGGARRPHRPARRRDQGRAARRQRARPAGDRCRGSSRSAGRAATATRRWCRRPSTSSSTAGCSRRGPDAGGRRHLPLRPHPRARRRLRRPGQGRAGPPARAAAAWAGASRRPAAPPGRRDVDGTAALQGERAVQLAAEMGLPRTDPAWRGRGLAFAALLRMGTAALARDEAEPAEGLLRRALALGAPSSARRCRRPTLALAHVRHAQALARLRRLDEAEQEVRPSSTAADGRLRAAALIVLGEVRRKRGETDAAREALVSALSTASEAGADRLTAEALRELGLLDHVDGRLRDAEERFRQAYALAVQVDDVRGAGWALQHLAWSATTRGDYALATEVLAQAAETFTALEDTGGLSWIAAPRATCACCRGSSCRPASSPGRCCRSAMPPASAGASRCCSRSTRWPRPSSGTSAPPPSQAERARQRFASLGDSWGRRLALIAGGRRPGRRPARPGLSSARAGRCSSPVRAATRSCTRWRWCRAATPASSAGDLDGAERAASRATAALGRASTSSRTRCSGAQVLLAAGAACAGRPARALDTVERALGGRARRPALLFPRRQALAHRAGILLQLGRTEQALAAAREAVATPGAGRAGAGPRPPGARLGAAGRRRRAGRPRGPHRGAADGALDRVSGRRSPSPRGCWRRCPAEPAAH